MKKRIRWDLRTDDMDGIVQAILDEGVPASYYKNDFCKKFLPVEPITQEKVNKAYDVLFNEKMDTSAKKRRIRELVNLDIMEFEYFLKAHFFTGEKKEEYETMRDIQKLVRRKPDVHMNLILRGRGIVEVVKGVKEPVRQAVNDVGKFTRTKKGQIDINGKKKNLSGKEVTNVKVSSKGLEKVEHEIAYILEQMETVDKFVVDRGKKKAIKNKK